jgi:hypothetical protein
MSYTLYYNNNDNNPNNNVKLFTTHTTTTWWQADYTLGHYTKYQLTMSATFNFTSSQEGFKEAFVTALQKQGIKPSGSGLTVSLTW